MDFPFPQYPWNVSSRPRYGRGFRGVPVQVMPEASPVQSLKPNTVSIPVRFLSSERGRSDSAIKIQKVFRGFLVRKNVKKIMATREEVNEIERSVLQKERMDLIRSDSKERLKVNEILMSLLFKLDSVSGVDSRVRDLRKSVIKKAITLQELVDAIVSGDQSVKSSNAEVVDQRQDNIDSSDNCIQPLESENLEETINDAEHLPDSCESERTAAAAIQGNEEEASETSRVDSFANHENTIEEEDENEKEEKLERIMEDNEKMMRLIEKLSERNETQTRMLCALTQRVEQLEKAFLCDKLRSKKRRNDDKSQDTEKFGGKR
ncbi:uncharacterized protein LOC120159086 isoform X2 [Hibiscus syriacus]|uniref:uncharacterized protein LOC120159086 isoform X2 n=1 Tax=Hibiscus syriacus TaxID=106335 RepID=UPI001924C0F4|nr:uncharacterized protein LOC120159086 isoform X2 [Hibiscus syriacus]